jgi:hypothetical protein
MASEASELPPVAVDLISKGIPAHKVLTPHIPLTAKQKALVEAIGAGATKREAYIMTHEPKTTNSKTVSMMASRAASADNVQAALSQQQAVERLRYSQNPLQIRSFLVDSLQHIARTAKKDSDRLGALRMLGQLADVAAFETRSVVTHERASDVSTRLRDKLARLSAIDVEARPVDDQAPHPDPTPPPPPQTGRASGGPTRSTNPHIPPSKSTDPPSSESDTLTRNLQDTLTPNLQDSLTADLQLIQPRGLINGVPLEDEDGDIGEDVYGETPPLEESLGSHSGGRKKKEKPIWEDPKRWYAETMGEVPKIEWAPREDAREEVQKRLRDDTGGG